MIIRVTAHGFAWTDPQGVTTLAKTLHGHHHCRYEQLKVFRNGELIDRASIHFIGTHGRFDGFDGLLRLAGPGRYREQIHVTLFKIGDELHIEGIPPGMQDEEYWKALTVIRRQKPAVSG